MGEWPNNLISQSTQLQNDDEAGAVLGKKQSLEIDSVFKDPKGNQNNR